MAEGEVTKTVIGRVGTNPEISETPTGKKLAKFRLAEAGYDRVAREPTTTWWDVSGFERDADIIEKNVRTGARIYVTGRASVYHGTTGDKDQIKVNEVGSAERFFPPADDEGGEW